MYHWKFPSTGYRWKFSMGVIFYPDARKYVIAARITTRLEWKYGGQSRKGFYICYFSYSSKTFSILREKCFLKFA